MPARRLRLRHLILACCFSSAAAADVSVPYARFLELYKAPGVVREPVWNDVRAQPDLYRGQVISYQIVVKGRIDSSAEARLIGYTRRDEQVTVVCPGGCQAGSLGVWVGVLGTLPDGDNPGHLVATAATQVRAPQLDTTTSEAAAAPGGANGAPGLSQTPTTPAAGEATAAVAPQSTTALAPRQPDGTAPLPPEALKQRAAPQPTPQQQRQAAEYQAVLAEAGVVARLERFITSRNSRIDPGERRLIATEVIRLSRYHGMRWEFFAAVIAAESDYNRKCVSSAGAMGLGQLMPFNCTEYGVSDPFDVRQNLAGSAQHLREFLDKYRTSDPQTQFELTLASYNAGPGAVRKYGGVPPYNETINYIRKIARLYVQLCQESAASG